jgi:DNA-directed RNA polymerase subunit RPC12/RpoP
MAASMLPTHDVDCPYCGKFLYSALSLENVVDADAPTSPKVETDVGGNYLRCPHCRARVAMTFVEVRGRPGFRLADRSKP